MSASALPLPLALNQPVPLATDLEAMFAASFGVDTVKYNPEAQMRASEFSWMRAGEINFTWTTSNTVVNDSEGVAVIDDSAQVDELEF